MHALRGYMHVARVLLFGPLVTCTLQVCCMGRLAKSLVATAGVKTSRGRIACGVHAQMLGGGGACARSKEGF